jgi:diguanylate cyclase (GGDEF)-like protein
MYASRVVKSSGPRADAALLAAGLDQMPCGFSIWNDRYCLVLWNNRFAEIYGFAPEDLIPGMSLREVSGLIVAAGHHEKRSANELFETYRDGLAAHTEASTVIVIETLSHDRIIKVSRTRSPGIGWVILHEDITEERQREKELATQNLRFDTAINQMAQGLCMFDPERRLVVSNRRYAEIYDLPTELMEPGTSLEEILAYRVSQGTSSPIGCGESYFRRRLELVTNGKADVDTVELQNGRIISILHQPMADGGWVSTHQDITEQRRNEARIQYLARHDPLTDLPNRAAFNEKLAEAEPRIRRGEHIAVLCIDLDLFKSVNDTLGHAVGDEVLKIVAARLGECCRETDVVARIGGDEFVLLHGPLQKPEDAGHPAGRVVEALGRPFEVQEHCILLGASVGIAVAPLDGADGETLVRHADLALYRAKAEGRGAYHFYEPGLDAALMKRRMVETRLRTALAAKEFRLVFQPMLNLKENRICALEALLRWDHPELGPMLPKEFVSIAEETGLIVPIGEWVLAEACSVAAGWPSDIRIAVNLSPVQFKSRNLVPSVKAALNAAGLNPERLELEITESVLLADNTTTLKILHELRALGIRISMDDFGTGYSSLSYLRSFPFDKIKIDRSFVHDSANKDGLAIVKAVVGLGRSLGIATTAEGVETESELDIVREEGCTEVQGFLFSLPLPREAASELLRGGTIRAESPLRAARPLAAGLQ